MNRNTIKDGKTVLNEIRLFFQKKCVILTPSTYRWQDVIYLEHNTPDVAVCRFPQQMHRNKGFLCSHALLQKQQDSNKQYGNGQINIVIRQIWKRGGQEGLWQEACFAMGFAHLVDKAANRRFYLVFHGSLQNS